MVLQLDRWEKLLNLRICINFWLQSLGWFRRVSPAGRVSCDCIFPFHLEAQKRDRSRFVTAQVVQKQLAFELPFTPYRNTPIVKGPQHSAFDREYHIFSCFPSLPRHLSDDQKVICD